MTPATAVTPSPASGNPTIDQIIPRGKQAWSVREAQARINLWVGAVRSGKTYSSLWRWLDYVRSGPAGNLVMIGKTMRTLKRNVLDPLAELLGPRRFRLVSGTGECFIFGRRVYLYGANNEGAKDKVMGLTAAGAYCDEVTLWPESVWTALLSRLSVTGAKLFGTTNPDAPAHWLKRRFIDRADELDMRVFHFSLDDNPALDPAYVTSLKREYVGLWYRRYILGQWALAAGAVYDMFDPDRHVVDEVPELGTTHYGGGDYGTSNPTVFLSLAEATHEEGDGWLISDEWRWDSRDKGRQMTDAQYSAAYQAWCGEVGEQRGLPEWPKATIIDPSAASFRLQLVNDGVPGVTPGDNAVLDGIRDVSTLLGQDRLWFHRSSDLGTIEEMMGYSWDEAAQKRGEDKPVKRDDHGPDAVRYLVRRAVRPRGRARVSGMRRRAA